MSILSDYISKNTNENPLPELLPIFHNCEAMDFKKILHDDELKTISCKVFNKNLLYFFYGKPSYPIYDKNSLIRTDSYYLPCCFIINTRKIEHINIYPFDTGAFKSGLYKSFMHRSMQVEDFQIGNNFKDIQNYISIIFGSNDNYLSGAANIFPKSEEEIVQSLEKMIAADGDLPFDERCYTIEIIKEEPLKLSEAIEALILPQTQSNRSYFLDYIETKGLKSLPVREYKLRNKAHPLGYNEVVTLYALDYIENGGWDNGLLSFSGIS